MQLLANAPCKGLSVNNMSEDGSLKDVALKESTLDDYGTSDLEKLDNFLGCGMSQISDDSQSLEGQESISLVPILDSRIELSSGLRQKRRRRRTTPQELAILEEEYLKDEKPNLLNRERIAARINSISTNEDKMGSREIQIWFQNRRQAVRRLTSYLALSNTHSKAVSDSLATKQSCYQMIDDERLKQHIEYKISSFKRIPSLRLCTNGGGKAQVMFNVLRENKTTYSTYKNKDNKSEGKNKLHPLGKENMPPVYEKDFKVEIGEDEMEACARSLVGLAQSGDMHNWQ